MVQERLKKERTDKESVLKRHNKIQHLITVSKHVIKFMVKQKHDCVKQVKYEILNKSLRREEIK